MEIIDKPQRLGPAFPATLIGGPRQQPDSPPDLSADRFEQARVPEQETGPGEALKAFALLGLALCGTGAVTASLTETSSTVMNLGGKRTYNADGSWQERVGNRVYYSDGTWQERVGDTLYHSDGTKSKRVRITVYRSDGTKSERVGNTVYRSDGVRSERVGNRIYSTDGTWQERIGDTIYHSDGSRTSVQDPGLGIEHNLWAD